LERDNSYHLVKDLIQGDEAVALLQEFNSLGTDDIMSALDKIVSDPTMSDRQKYQILNESWRVNYRIKPPTIEEFLTPEWIGPTADSLYPHVRKILTEFWQPDSQYRHLVLGMSIGTGKALPDSSPVMIDEEPAIEIELEDGKKLVFGEEDKIVIFDHSVKIIKAKDLSLVEQIDFPVLLNYFLMKVYNVEKIPEFKEAFEILSYEELIAFFRKFDKDFYRERDIVTNSHHIIPRCEGGDDQDSNLVDIPFYFHVKAHYLRAKELEEKGNIRFASKNYRSVQYSLGIKYIPKDVQEAFKNIQFVVEALEKRNFYERKKFFIRKDNEKTRKIFEEEWPEYEKLGWSKGRDFKNPSTKKWVNKNGKSHYVEKEKLEEYLVDDYELGMFITDKIKESNRRKIVHSTLNTIWMNKDGKRKCVRKEEVKKYEENGWSTGSLSETNKGQRWSWKEESKGQKWFTNGVENLLSKECPDGFWPGITKKNKHKKWYTNGVDSIFAEVCPEGYHLGKKMKEHWYTNGYQSIFTKECPEGYWRGKTTNLHWYNNGKISIQAKECPEGFKPGRMKYESKKNK
jgi:hypothetical protein